MPETTTAAKPEAKPERKPETKPEAKPETKPDVKPKPEQKPDGSVMVEITGSVRHNGKPYKSGATLSMSRKDAERLVRLNQAIIKD